MPVLAGKLTARRQGKTLQRAISHRIMELDDDIITLKERRELGYISTKEVTQINRLIKLFEATIKELQAAL